MIYNYKSFMLNENITQMRTFLHSRGLDDLEKDLEFIKTKFAKKPNYISIFTKIMVGDDGKIHGTEAQFDRVADWIINKNHLVSKLQYKLTDFDNIEDVQDAIRIVEYYELALKFYRSLYASMRESIDKLDEDDRADLDKTAMVFMELDPEIRKTFPPMKYFKENNINVKDLKLAMDTFIESGVVNSTRNGVLETIKRLGKSTVVHDEDNVLVLYTTDREVVAALGSQRWCIVYAQDNYFNQYVGGANMGTQFICFNFNLPQSSRYSLIGLTVFMNGDIPYGGSQDRENANIPVNEIIELLNVERSVFASPYQKILDKVLNSKNVLVSLEEEDINSDLVNWLFKKPDFKDKLQEDINKIIGDGINFDSSDLQKLLQQLTSDFYNGIKENRGKIVAIIYRLLIGTKHEETMESFIKDNGIVFDFTDAEGILLNQIKKSDNIFKLFSDTNVKINILDWIKNKKEFDEKIDEMLKPFIDEPSNSTLNIESLLEPLKNEYYTIISEHRNEFLSIVFINLIYTKHIDYVINFIEALEIDINDFLLEYLIPENYYDYPMKYENYGEVIEKFEIENAYDETAFYYIGYEYTKKGTDVNEYHKKVLYSALELDKKGHATLMFDDYSDMNFMFDEDLSPLDDNSDHFYDHYDFTDEWSDVLDNLSIDSVIAIYETLSGSGAELLYQDIYTKYNNPEYTKLSYTKCGEIFSNKEEHADIQTLISYIKNIINDNSDDYDEDDEDSPSHIDENVLSDIRDKMDQAYSVSYGSGVQEEIYKSVLSALEEFGILQQKGDTEQILTRDDKDNLCLVFDPLYYIDKIGLDAVTNYNGGSDFSDVTVAEAYFDVERTLSFDDNPYPSINYDYLNEDFVDRLN